MEKGTPLLGRIIAGLTLLLSLRRPALLEVNFSSSGAEERDGETSNHSLGSHLPPFPLLLSPSSKSSGVGGHSFIS